MKIVSSTPAAAGPAVPPSAVDRSPDRREFQNQLDSLKNELAGWRERMETRLSELREAAQPAATESTERVLKDLQSLSERVRGLETAKVPRQEQLSEEIRSICRRELEALDQRVTSALAQAAEQKSAAPAPAVPAGPDPELTALQKKLADQASAWEHRFREDEEALEALRREVAANTEKKDAPAPPAETKPVEAVAEKPTVTAPEASAEPAAEESEREAEPEPSAVGALLSEEQKPSLWKRFWNYMNAPAFKETK